jgi:hypothetical protein
MRISASYTVDDWKELAFCSEVDWELAVDMFKNRLKTRYLDHIDLLISRKTSGFAVLSLDCVLVETLQQFRNGTKNTPHRKGQQYFIDFLIGTAFAKHFTEETAKIFYAEIRCGLLHQSEAEGTSRLKRGPSRWLLSQPIKRVSSSTFIVFMTYSRKSSSPTLKELLHPKSVEARIAFRKKMNFICRVEGKAI